MRLPGFGGPLALATVLSCTASLVDAQEWAAGVKSGISRFEQTLSSEFEWSPTVPNSAFISRSISGPFSLQPELAYVRRNGVSSLPGSNLTLVADFLELPIMLQLRLGSAKAVSPYVALGPSFAFRLRCRLRFEGGGVRSDDDCDAARGVRSNRFDVGAAGGAGINWTVGAMTFGAEARATAGLRTRVLPIDVENARSLGWSLLAGVSTPLYRKRARPPVWMPPLAEAPVVAAPAPAPAPAASGGVVYTTEGKRISVTASDVDVRELILAIADSVGLEIVVSPEIRSRVSVSLTRVRAEDAIQAIVDVAGLSLTQRPAPGRTAIVFRAVPPRF